MISHLDNVTDKFEINRIVDVEHSFDEDEGQFIFWAQWRITDDMIGIIRQRVWRDKVRDFVSEASLPDHYTGYVGIKGDELPSQDDVNELEVYGGVTWVEEKLGYIWYGFDTGHGEFPMPEYLSDFGWLRDQIEKLASQLMDQPTIK